MNRAAPAAGPCGGCSRRSHNSPGSRGTGAPLPFLRRFPAHQSAFGHGAVAAGEQRCRGPAVSPSSPQAGGACGQGRSPVAALPPRELRQMGITLASLLHHSWSLCNLCNPKAKN